MINRKIENRIREFYKKDKKALLITGARQVGKTYIIRKVGKADFESFIEINFLENRTAQSLFKNAKSSTDIQLRISAITDQPLVTGKTLIFFDKVQECKELVTAIKFLVEEGSYRYILSGSLLGVDLKDIRSAPVGYMDIFEMFPLDFEEFSLANGVSQRVIDSLRNAYETQTPVDVIVHEKMMDAGIRFSYESDTLGFKFILYRPAIQSDIPSVTLDVTLNGTEMAVLAILKQKPDSSRGEIADKISKTVRTVQRALDSLRDKGYIRRIGSKQVPRWEILK